MYRGRHGWKQQARWREAHTAAREAVAAGGRPCTASVRFAFSNTQGNGNSRTTNPVPYPNIYLDAIYFIALKCFPFRKLLSVRSF